MKNGTVKARTENHARLLAKRLLSSKPRDFSRAACTPSSGDDNFLAGTYSTKSKSSNFIHPCFQLLVAKASQTVSAKANRPTHPHSSTTTGLLSDKVPPPSSSTTAVPASNQKSSESHVSGVAMGLAFGLIGCAIFVIVAVWALRRRKTQGDTPNHRWKEDPFSTVVGPGTSSARPETMIGLPKHSNKKSEGYFRLGDEKALSSVMNEKSSLYTDAHSSFLGQSMVITPPGNTLNNSSRPHSAASLSPSSAAKRWELARVLRAFLPTLPDELQIHQGETIEILNSFDDGWALCLNQHGEKGVVPLECLSRNANKEGLNPQDGDRNQYRLSKRASSLYVGVSPGSY